MKILLTLIALILFNGCATRTYVCNHKEEIAKLQKENLVRLADLAICKLWLNLDLDESEGGK